MKRLAPLVLLSLLVASPAAAQSADPPLTSVPATAKAAAQESFARGNRLFNQAEQKHDRTLYEAAYLQFSQAFAIYPDDRILWNLIVSEIKTDRDVDGLRHLRAYDKRQHVADQPRHPYHALFSSLFDQASKATGHLVIEAPVAAPLRVDGTDIGTAPLADPVDVQPGPHKLEAVVGRTVLSASASPAAGEVVHVALTEPPDPPLASTSLQRPAASVPSPERDVAPPTGFFTTRNTITLGLGVVAVGALAVGTGFEVASRSEQGTANGLGGQLPTGGNVCSSGSTVPQCAQLRDANSSAASHQNAATALFVTGGVAGVAAVGVLLLWPSHSDARAGMLSPMILPSTGGLQWLGTF
jgi:hypothetical protein